MSFARGARINRPAVLASFLVLAVFALVAGGIYGLLTSRAPIVVWDFHPSWLGLRAMLRDGIDPYGEEATQLIQSQILGRAAVPGENQNAFAYPLHILVIIGPLALLPLAAAQAIWLSLLVLSLLIVSLAGSCAVGWRPPAWLLALTVLFTLGLYQDVWALILGQVSLVVAAFIALAWWSVRTAHWRAAGMCLALSTIKPQMTFLLVPALLAWAVYERRWKLVLAFAVTMGALVLLPALWLPNWPIEWLAALGQYAGYTSFDPLLVLLVRSPMLAWLIALTLMAGVTWRWWRAADRGGDALDWALAAAIVISTLIAPRTTQANQAVLLLPLFVVFARLPKHGLAAMVEVGLLAGLWWLDASFAPELNTPEHSLWQHQVISPILPLALTLALMLIQPRSQV
ncbi:MAG TPA: glycosyltransferase 87 family protein [Anaerolineae bacterium]